MKEKELHHMWEMFVKDARLHCDLDPIVKSSWLRSKMNKVDPYQATGKEKLSEHELKLLVEKKRELIQISLPLMNTLYSLVKGSGFLVILCDESGYLLKVIGDRDPLIAAEKIQFVEGANWSEEVMGTNAIGTAIKVGTPIQIFSYQHYTIATQSWTCSASPIYEGNGQLVGVLNMSGPFEKVHPHTLGMVVSTAKAIENELQLKEKIEKNELMKSYLEETTNTLSDGIIIINEKGTIIKTNKTLQKMLHLHPDEIEGVKLTNVFENRTIESFLLLSQEVVDREIKLRIRKNGVHLSVLFNAKPIIRGLQVIGSLVTVKEIKKVRLFVNHVSGNQAKVTFNEMIGENERFLDCLHEAKLAAQSASTVLIMGESGTGKDLLAQAIHNESSRRQNPFLAINCGGIPRDLLGSELFGYVEGAFTGARKGGSAGKFELADGGTLFLDEIGEMSLEMQVLLLRVLQNREVVRIGGFKVVPVNVRIIAATNKNLKQEVQKGNFREDLYFRLNVMPITMTSLRERKDDIPLLVHHFSSQLAYGLQKSIPAIRNEVMDLLTKYQWPGNVRELQNILERAIVKSSGRDLTADLFPEEITGLHSLPENPRLLLPRKDELKKQALMDSITKYNGNFSKAAKYLGISRSTLYRQMERYNIR
ncbi:sigma-54-dependent Fis family transcriptional regulator [Bacillus canaveralius]|uniref:Sigma-54-dependent Fis family transcriptional regulator n=1 Tax=Bacillus canaveralius TaxID=1403243 RepID=A0A2N5GHB1_9BACI|nr:sigma-54-dependent Fis family transcriptional regulator [Bacillus canaveralius]PLR80177.1 sigma-54-dependent Fis family transcriptional regulator [Bacillus canaveralius]PLR98680.1 sigma-54-dependent Fis family transcriptional regulator [Bacillus canaveralius]RSK48180.1 sigma-54-dependent Fis family transcriptional regulator [Bacillus canaveralius]